MRRFAKSRYWRAINPPIPACSPRFVDEDQPMPTHASSPRRPPRTSSDRASGLFLIALLTVAALGVWAVAVASGTSRPVVVAAAAAAVIVTALAGVLTASRGRHVHQLAAQVADLETRLDGLRAHSRAQQARMAHLADHTLPAVVARLRDGSSPDAALAEVAEMANVPAADGSGPVRTASPVEPSTRTAAATSTATATDTELDEIAHQAEDAHQRILRTLATEIGRGERMRAAAMSACANAAGRVQALSTSMLADLREMEDRHDEAVLGDLLRLDHATAQAGRLADSIAVLTGARSGRRWTRPIVMESILRGAVGRISAYQRVRLHSTSTVSVAGYAAESVMHALAELMDNATSFSPPSEEVHVYVEEVQAGIVVTIEDGGLVMGPAALHRAELAVSATPLDLTTLSGTRLGLAVVGVLARKHDLTVSFRPSSRGGTGVVVLIPRRLLATPRPSAALPGATAPDAAGPDTASTSTQALVMGDASDLAGAGTPRLAAAPSPPTRISRAQEALTAGAVALGRGPGDPTATGPMLVTPTGPAAASGQERSSPQTTAAPILSPEPTSLGSTSLGSAPPLGSAASGSVQPGSAASGSVQPGSAVPGSVVPGSVAPAAAQPGGALPKRRRGKTMANAAGRTSRAGVPLASAAEAGNAQVGAAQTGSAPAGAAPSGASGRGASGADVRRAGAGSKRAPDAGARFSAFRQAARGGSPPNGAATTPAARMPAGPDPLPAGPAPLPAASDPTPADPAPAPVQDPPLLALPPQVAGLAGLQPHSREVDAESERMAWFGPRHGGDATGPIAPTEPADTGHTAAEGSPLRGNSTF